MSTASSLRCYRSQSGGDKWHYLDYLESDHFQVRCWHEEVVGLASPVLCEATWPILRISQYVVEYETLDLSQPHHANAAILFVRSTAHWLKMIHRAHICKLLQVECDYLLTRKQVLLSRRVQMCVLTLALPILDNHLKSILMMRPPCWFCIMSRPIICLDFETPHFPTLAWMSDKLLLSLACFPRRLIKQAA